MSRSPPHVIHYKVHDDVRKLLENIYLKKVGKNNDKLNNQVLNSISEVFDGTQQQVKQGQIQKLKERLDTLCNSQYYDQQSPNKYSPSPQQQQPQAFESNLQMKLPKLFQHRDTAALIASKYQYGSQLSSRLEQQNAKSQRSYSPQPLLNQKEQMLRAYCNDYISETPKHLDKKSYLLQDRNTSYDTTTNQNQISTIASRRKGKYSEYSSMLPPPQSYQIIEDRQKIIPNVISSLHNTPTRTNIKQLQFKGKSKREESQYERSKHQVQSSTDNRNITEQEDRDIYNNQNSRKFNKVVFLSSQKGEAPERYDKIKRMNTNSVSYINEFTDIPQNTQASIKNINESVDNIKQYEIQNGKQSERYGHRIHKKDNSKGNDQQKQIVVEILNNQSPTYQFYNKQNTQNINLVKNSKTNGQERSSSQNSYLKENNLIGVSSNRVNTNNKNQQYKQKSHLNNSMIVIQDESPVHNNLKQSLQIIPNKDNPFIKEVRSTQEYLKAHNNDLWTLIAKFNIQKDLDKKKKEQQQFQEQINNLKHELEHQIQEKHEMEKNQFTVDQEYSQIAKRQIEKMNETRENERFEIQQKKRQQTMYLEDQMVEREEQKQKVKKQIEVDNQQFIQNLKKLQNEEEQSKINQIKKQKQLYEGIKQDYFERFKKGNTFESNEDTKLNFEKKRIATYFKELDGQRQHSSQSSYNNPLEKLTQREKIKPVDEEILKEWAEQINQKQKEYTFSKNQDKKQLDEYIHQCEKEDESELRKNIEYKVKVALNQQQVKEQVQKKKSAKVPAASDFDIQNNLSVLKEIDDYIKKSQLIED